MVLFQYIRAACHLLILVLLGTTHHVLSEETETDREAVTRLEERQSAGVVSVGDFMRRAYQTSVVAENWLYIDGGEFSFKDGDTIIYQYSSTILSIDLSQDWVNDTLVFHSTRKPTGAPKLSVTSSLWYDEDKRLMYSGLTGRVTKWGDAPSPPPLSLWSFKPDGLGSGTWNEEISDTDSRLNNLKRSDLAYVASGGTVGLALGGTVSDLSEPETSEIYQISGIVQLNMTTQQISNSTAMGFTSNGTGFSGQMHYVPSFGSEGVFLAMGGKKFEDNDTLFDFDNIWVYEAGTQNFYKQQASGNVPEGRVGFCLAGINSTEESYEIFLYGGTNSHLGPDAVPFDEIFILTLPAFTWMKVDYPPQHPRGGHSCNAVGGSQIISIGGFDANPEFFINVSYDDIDRSILNTSADPFAQGLGIFDLTTLTWADHYTANAPPYTQSDMVKEYYRNNPPDGTQFSSPALRDIFRTTHFTPISTTSTNSSTTNSTSSSPASPTSTPPSSTNKGAIAGGVVGGVAALAAITGIIIYLRRRRSQNLGNGAPTPAAVDHTTAPERYHDNMVQEVSNDAQYKGAQLEGNGIQEMQHPPAEMGDGGLHANQQGGRYEMEASQRRW